jgi:DNA polymerase-1
VDILANLHDAKVLAIDVEATGLEWYADDRMFGVAIAAWDGKQIHSDYYDIRQRPRVLELLKREAPKIKVPVVNHSIKFDYHMLEKEGVRLPVGKIECTMVRMGLIDEHRFEYGLDACAKDILGEGKIDIWNEMAKLFGGASTRTVQIRNLHRAPSALAAKYATPDPVLALKLWLWQKDEIIKQELDRVWGLEKQLTPVLIDIERSGIRVDVARAKDAEQRVAGMIHERESKMRKLLGSDFNPNSPPQVKALFKPEKRDDGNWYVKDVLLEKTEGGGPSMNKDALMELAVRHKDERAQLIVDLRKYIKAKQFFTNHIIGHLHGDRVYPNYNQTKSDNGKGVGPGRLSMDEPAMQQIPKRDEDIAEETRSCFLPEKGERWCSADWAQFEFRWFAHYVQDQQILAAYKKDPATDYHQIVADITGIPRKPRYAGDANSKQINLGLVFGMGQGKLAAEMGLEYTVEHRRGREFLVPGDKAKEIFSTYHAAIPGVQVLLDKAASIARSRGYVLTAMGRHLRFPQGQFTHKAGGLVFQGTSADCMKQKMITLHAMSKKFGFRYLLSVHDEHNTSVPKGKIGDKLAAQIKRELEIFDGDRCPIRCDIPIRSEIGIGPNWWEACK